MENSLLVANFVPPAPYTIEGHFDRLTGNRASDATLRSVNMFGSFESDVRGLLATISNVPNAVERVALLTVLEGRLRTLGETRRFLEPRAPTAKSAGEVLTNYFITDVLGLSGDSVEQKLANDARGLLRRHFEKHLNDQGKSQHTFVKGIWDVINAKTPMERHRAVLAGVSDKLELLLKGSEKTILTAMARRGPISAAVAGRLRKVIALRMAWRVTLVTRLAWVNPLILGLDLLLTPEQIASDEKMIFLGIYTQVCQDNRILQSKIVESSGPTDWKFRLDPIAELRATIRGG